MYTMGPNNSVQRTIEAIMDEADMQNASMSVYVQDLNTRQIIAKYNEKTSLVPASTMKILTTASAIEILGPWYTFKTQIQYDGEIDSSGVLHGNIYIKGGGDPALGSKYFSKHYGDFMKNWVEAIRNLGVKKIDGQIIGDATSYIYNTIPASWSWGDIGNYYGAAPNGLTIHDNMCMLQFKSGENAGDSTFISCVVPYVPEMEFENEVIAANSSKDNAYVYGGAYDPFHFVEGSIPKNKEEFEVKASIHDPAYLAAFELESALYDDSIKVEYGFSTIRRLKKEGWIFSSERKDLYTQKSPSVSSIVYWVNMVSVNLFAEHLLTGISYLKYVKGHTYSGRQAL
jgi:D-alanyl-D-alanine carboxypeptidase/D-alanyl-D-alanine-endopeptidase (penicillin-binding protein 4)